jgi:hypothetical protein
MLLAGCATPSSPIVTVGCHPASDLLVPPAAVASVPIRALTEQDVVRYWMRDRANAKRVGERYASLQQFIRGECQ